MFSKPIPPKLNPELGLNNELQEALVKLKSHHVSHGRSGNGPLVPLEFTQLLEDKLQDLPDVSQTLCVSVLQKGREALPEDAHNHIYFLVSQDPNFDHQDIGCCPHGKTPVMVDWKKPWYLIYIYDWTCSGDPPRLCDPKTEEYPKRYCPLHMDAELLKQFYAEFDCGIGVNMKERFQLDCYEWNSEPRGYDADCRLVRVSEKKRSAPTPNAEEYSGEDDKITLMVELTNAKKGSYTNYSSGDPKRCYESLEYLLSQENITFEKGPSFDVTIAVCDFDTVKKHLAYYDLQYKKKNADGNMIDNTYFIVDKLLTKEAIEAALDGTVHDVVTWLKNPNDTEFYSSYRNGRNTIGFSNPLFKELYVRRSVAPRRGYSGRKEDAEVYDLIIKRIEIYGPYTKKGWGTKFAENLLADLRREEMERWMSIHIEQLCSDDGISWGESLIKRHNWYKQLDIIGGDLNVFSPREELTRSNAMLPNGVTPMINPSALKKRKHEDEEQSVKRAKTNKEL